MSLALALGSIPAPYPPPRKKASFMERTFCCQDSHLKEKKCLNLLEACSFTHPRGNSVILYLSLIPPLWTWHGDMLPCTILLQSWMKRHKYWIREKNPPGPRHPWLHLPLFFLVHVLLTQGPKEGELLQESAQALLTTGVTMTIWHFHLESI